ncbi:sporulation protein [Streptomyces sp. NPDC059256]|uniref:sporulation protein n=1 Tax=Streptomyces sp. NPDC059256 TaxID=3346794 RepID=UPI003678364C
MVFKRLFGKSGATAEVETEIAPGPSYPGGPLKGEVCVRSVEGVFKVDYVSLELGVQADEPSGEHTYRYLGRISSGISWVTLQKGEEQRKSFEERLKWETPLTEISGQTVGVVLGVRTGLEEEGGEPEQRDYDLVHVAALPLHEVIFNALAGAGYSWESSQVKEERVPDTESHLYCHQVFVLRDQLSTADRPATLELTFVTNAVGCEIYLRPGAPDQFYWRDKPTAHRYIAAHHDVGKVDFAFEARRWVDEVTQAAR